MNIGGVFNPVGSLKVQAQLRIHEEDVLDNTVWMDFKLGVWIDDFEERLESNEHINLEGEKGEDTE